MLFRLLCGVVLLTSLAMALPLGSGDVQIWLKFEETAGASQFMDSSVNARQATCGMSGASCPKSGVAGVSGNAVSFASACDRSFGNNQADVIVKAASCGSKLTFPTVQLNDGTVMLWYSETGLSDGFPINVAAPEAPPMYRRTGSVQGWDLSLVGGAEFFVGRLSRNEWGGYWCGKWHIAKPMTSVGDSEKGWDFLGWHHLAVTFAGSSALVYVDGTMVAIFQNAGGCTKNIAWLGERTVRYTEQNGFRDTEQTGQNDSRPRANLAAVYQYVLAATRWSTNYYAGLMDDFRITRTPYSQAQIRAAMTGM